MSISYVKKEGEKAKGGYETERLSDKMKPNEKKPTRKSPTYLLNHPKKPAAN